MLLNAVRLESGQVLWCTLKTITMSSQFQTANNDMKTLKQKHSIANVATS